MCKIVDFRKRSVISWLPDFTGGKHRTFIKVMRTAIGVMRRNPFTLSMSENLNTWGGCLGLNMFVVLAMYSEIDVLNHLDTTASRCDIIK